MTGIVDRKAEGGPFTRPVISIATSAGGLSALSQLLSALPPTLDAAILVVQHLDPDRPSHLADILGRRTTLPVKQAASADRLHPGAVFIAPPGAHLWTRTASSPSRTGRRSTSFAPPRTASESIAGSFGSRGVAVVLTGTGHDGATGAQAVKRAGGKVIVQDESTSQFFGMPKSAIDACQVDLILPLDKIAPAPVALCGGPA